MIGNYVKIAWRNFRRDNIFSVINITGLAVGIACFLTLFLFIQDEFNHDKITTPGGVENVYRIFVKTRINGEDGSTSKTSGRLGPTLMHDFPEVRNFLRIGYYGGHAFQTGTSIYRTGNVYAADSTFFQIFPVKFLVGDAKSALRHPNSLVLTQRAASKIFNDSTPVGKTITTLEGKTFMVTGLIEDFPMNLHFSCEILESLSTYEVNPNWLDLWFSTYIILEPGTPAAEFEKKLSSTVMRYVGPEAEHKLNVSMQEFFKEGNHYGFYLQPFSSIYLQSSRIYGIDPNTEWSNVKMGDIAYTYSFIGIAIFILLLAVINFTNLATAKSERRAREVGVRKTFGSRRSALIIQFMAEAASLCFISMLLGIVILAAILPLFNSLVERDLHFYIINEYLTIPILLVFVLVVGIISGLYPALYLSSFSPQAVLKSNNRADSGRVMLRSSLVIIQFSIAIALVTGTIIMRNQLNFMQKKNLGFNKEHLMSINNAVVLKDHMESFKNELAKDPSIVSCTNASRMFTAGVPGSGFLYNKTSGTDPVLCQLIDVDDDFQKTYGISMSAGRFFERDMLSDSAAVVINEAAARAFTSDDPIGKNLISLDAREEGRPYKIIGIIRDFNYESLHRQVRPLVLQLHSPRQPANILTIRIAVGDTRKTIHFVQKTWKKFANEGEALSYTFVDETLGNLYKNEQKTRIVSEVFSGIAVFIACIGLFGLAAFVTEQRTKEIGVRKVLGASVLKLVMLLSREFLGWVVVANIIAWPVAYLAMKSWLQNFAFRTPLSFTIFLIASLLTLMLALLTVAFHTIKAARANPVNSLKYE